MIITPDYGCCPYLTTKILMQKLNNQKLSARWRQYHSNTQVGFRLDGLKTSISIMGCKDNGDPVFLAGWSQRDLAATGQASLWFRLTGIDVDPLNGQDS